MAISKKMKSVFGHLKVPFNIANTLIGIGIIALPEAFLKGGLIFTFILSVFVLLIIYYTSLIMVSSSTKVENVRTYGELCKAAYGNIFKYILCFTVFWLMYGYIAVYSITLKSEFENIMGDIQGSTFQYGSISLVGISFVIILPPLIFKNIDKLAGFSFISILCVIFVIITAVVRAPHYYALLNAQTRDKITNLEKNFHIDRAIWTCNPNKPNVKLENWPSLDVQNYDVLNNALKTDGVCHGKLTDPNAVTNSINKIGDNPVIGNVQSGINTWEEVVSYEHSRYLFSIYSLNDFGANNAKFTLFSFANANFLRAIGTISSAFIYEQATMANYYSLEENKRNIPYYRKQVMFSFIFVYVCCITLAFSGYFGQQYQVGQFIFTKLQPRYFGEKPDIMIIASRFLTIIYIALTYPMQFFYGRVNLNMLVVTFVNKFFGKRYDPQDPPNLIFYIDTLIMFSTSLLIGLFVKEATKIFAVVGSLFGGPMIFIYPVICLIAIDGGFKQYYNYAKAKNSWGILSKIIFPAFVVLFGVLATVLSTVFSIIL